MSKSMNNMRTPLSRVRGLGSAKSGTDHWWHQRLTALALIPLSVWFAASLVSLSTGTLQEVKAWFSSPVVSGLMILLIGATFYHLKLGIQVVIEDYIHVEWLKIMSLIVVAFGCIILGLGSIMAVIWLWIGG